MISSSAPLLAFLLVALALLPILAFALGIALGLRLRPSGAQLPASPRSAEPPHPEHHRRVVEGFLPPSKREGGRHGGHWRMILVFSWWPAGEETARRTVRP